MSQTCTLTLRCPERSGIVHAIDSLSPDGSDLPVR